MKTLFLLLIIILSGCGKGPNNIDPTFQPLYDSFVADASQAGIDLSGNQGIRIQFVDISISLPLGEEVGECSSPGYGNDIVSIDPNFWQYANYELQYLLIYHELGHCLLDENHATNPDAIMNAYVNFPLNYYSNELPQMLQQLFNQMGDNG